MEGSRKLTAEECAAVEAMRNKIRFAVSQLVISILRTMSQLRFENGDLHKTVDLSLIAFAVYIGEYEGRPMTPYKLAQFLGVPRSTLIRRVEVLIEKGCLVRSGKVLGVSRDWLNAPEGVLLARQMSALVLSFNRMTAQIGDDTAAMLGAIDTRLMADCP